MNAHPKVWVLSGAVGTDATCIEPTPDQRRLVADNDCTLTECVAVPVEEWARVQRELEELHADLERTLNEHSAQISRLTVARFVNRRRALDTTTPTTEAK